MIRTGNRMSCFPTFALSAALVLATALTSPPARAETWQGGLLHNDVTMEVPAPFAPAPAFADANDTQAIVEFLPPGETIEVWSQMLTLTAFVDTSGQTAEQAVDAMANHLASGYGGACPDSFAAEDLGSPAVPGAEAALAGWLGCGTVGGGPSEAMVVLVLAAGGKIMTVQWAERGPGSADPMAFDMNQWLPRLDVLMGFQL